MENKKQWKSRMKIVKIKSLFKYCTIGEWSGDCRINEHKNLANMQNFILAR